MLALSDLVAKRVRQIRSSKGWSQEQLAEAAELSRDAVSRIERGDRAPRLETLDSIARALGLKLPALLDVDRGIQIERESTTEARISTMRRHLGSVDERFGDALVRAVAFLCQGHRAETRRVRGDLLKVAEPEIRYGPKRKRRRTRTG